MSGFLSRLLSVALSIFQFLSIFGPQIWIWKDLGPMSFWSSGHSLSRRDCKTQVVGDLTKSYFVRLDTPYPVPWGIRGPAGCAVGFWSLTHVFWQKLKKTKVDKHPQYSRVGTHFQTPNMAQEGPGHHVSLEVWSLTFKERL